MPIIHITLPEGVLNSEKKTSLADQLTQILLHWEGNAGNTRVQSYVLVYFAEVNAEAHAVGGTSYNRALPTHYTARITVPAGVLSDEAKNGLVADMTRAVLDAEGTAVDFASSLRIYCLIDEVADGNWGMGGRILRLQDMAALFNPVAQTT